MNRITKKGKKDSQDVKYGLNCNCGKDHFPSYEDIAWMIFNCMNNEDVLYPPDDYIKGGRMLHDYFNETMIYRKLPDRKKYKL